MKIIAPRTSEIYTSGFISPEGEPYEVSDTRHGDWILIHYRWLSQNYKIVPPKGFNTNKDIESYDEIPIYPGNVSDGLRDQLVKQGWIHVFSPEFLHVWVYDNRIQGIIRQAFKSGDIAVETNEVKIYEGSTGKKHTMILNESFGFASHLLSESPDGFYDHTNAKISWSDSEDNATIILQKDGELCVCSVSVRRDEPVKTEHPFRGQVTSYFSGHTICIDSAGLAYDFYHPARQAPTVHEMLASEHAHIVKMIVGGIESDYVASEVFVRNRKEWISKQTLITDKRPGSIHIRLFPNNKVLSTWIRKSELKDHIPAIKNFIAMWNSVAKKYKQDTIDSSWRIDASMMEEAQFIPLTQLGVELEKKESPKFSKAVSSPKLTPEMIRDTKDISLLSSDLLKSFYHKATSSKDQAMLSAFAQIWNKYNAWKTGTSSEDDYAEILQNVLVPLQKRGELTLGESKDNNSYSAYKDKLISIMRSKKLSPIKMVKLNGIEAMFIGVVEGISLYAVNGDQVKKKLYTGFVDGGNDLSSAFIPRKTVWVDVAIEREQWSAIILHELMERYLIEERGYGYSEAHTIANRVEKQFRISSEGL